MEKFKKSQILNLFLIAALLIITPLLSTSLRSTYLYLIVNILIIVVGADAGLLSFFLESPVQNKRRANSALKPLIISEFSPDKEKTAADQLGDGTNSLADKVVEKRSSEKILGAVEEQKKVKKSPSTPSIFFIGGSESAAEAEEVVEDINDQGEEVSGQELFQKAETFIGNFYKQLKMQREESWKKLHDLYQKAF